ncbi:DUF998 domain-containing protein [Actinorhabdospora filicis]|nr:DUF998 domain-containing protein [Actinorhabdospora filicis]
MNTRTAPVLPAFAASLLPVLAPLLGGLAALLAVLGVLAGHFDTTTLSPWVHTISDYAAADRGGPVETGIFLAGLGALPLIPALWRLSKTAACLAGAWVAGLIVTAIVPTDPLGHVTMSTAGYVHRYASTVAFAALVIAAVILARRLRSVLYAVLSGLSILGGLWVTWATYCGGRVLIGLGERVLAFAMLTLLIVLAGRIARAHLRAVPAFA